MISVCDLLPVTLFGAISWSHSPSCFTIYNQLEWKWMCIGLGCATSNLNVECETGSKHSHTKFRKLMDFFFLHLRLILNEMETVCHCSMHTSVCACDAHFLLSNSIFISLVCQAKVTCEAPTFQWFDFIYLHLARIDSDGARGSGAYCGTHTLMPIK